MYTGDVSTKSTSPVILQPTKKGPDTYCSRRNSKDTITGSKSWSFGICKTTVGARSYRVKVRDAMYR